MITDVIVDKIGFTIGTLLESTIGDTIEREMNRIDFRMGAKLRSYETLNFEQAMKYLTALPKGIAVTAATFYDPIDNCPKSQTMDYLIELVSSEFDRQDYTTPAPLRCARYKEGGPEPEDNIVYGSAEAVIHHHVFESTINEDTLHQITFEHHFNYKDGFTGIMPKVIRGLVAEFRTPSDVPKYATK